MFFGCAGDMVARRVLRTRRGLRAYHLVSLSCLAWLRAYVRASVVVAVAACLAGLTRIASGTCLAWRVSAGVSASAVYGVVLTVPAGISLSPYPYSSFSCTISPSSREVNSEYPNVVTYERGTNVHAAAERRKPKAYRSEEKIRGSGP